MGRLATRFGIALAYQTGRAAIYINFWYPVGTSAEIGTEEPLRVKVLGVSLVAFRDNDGNPHVLADTCVHRGGSLGRGKITNGAVACPYHGWQFDGSGRCVRLPSLRDGAKIPGRAKVDSYPTTERYGIVFAFLGDVPEAERPPAGEIFEWEQKGWRSSDVKIIELEAYFERSIENGLDPVHNEFVHELQGNIRFQPERMEVTRTAWGAKVYVRMDPPEPGTTALEKLRNDEKPEHFGAITKNHGPNNLITAISLSKDNQFIQYFFEQPVDDSHTRIFFVNMRNCMLDEEQDEHINRINLGIAAEDASIISELYPIRTPESMNKELLTVGDECIGGYRAKLKEWESLGWRIDRKKLLRHDGDIAYAIPSPARRTEKNWVHDPVPLLPASK